jgi:hypothetical protein
LTCSSPAGRSTTPTVGRISVIHFGTTLGESFLDHAARTPWPKCGRCGCTYASADVAPHLLNRKLRYVTELCPIIRKRADDAKDTCGIV